MLVKFKLEIINEVYLYMFFTKEIDDLMYFQCKELMHAPLRKRNHACMHACIYPNERTKDKRRLINIAAAEAKRKEKTKKDIVIRAIPFIPELDIYVAVYESPFKTRRIMPLKLEEGR